MVKFSDPKQWGWSMSGKQRGETAELWRRRLRRQARGTWTVAEFCRREGVSQPSFYQWRKRLADNSQPVPKKPRRNRQSDPEFLPLELPSSLLAVGVQIELPGGAVVRLPQDASAEIVAAAVGAACERHFNREAQSC